MAREHSLAEYDFRHGDEINKKLVTNFKSLEALVHTGVAEIQKTVGVTRGKAQKIHLYAVEHLSTIERLGDAAIHTKVDRPLRTSDKQDSSPPDKSEDEGKSDEERYVMTEQPIDKLNTLRKRILLTPSVCSKCGLDIIALNRLVPYEELNESDKLKVRKALEQHISENHIVSEDRVISKSQMNQSSWLHSAL